MKPIQDDTKITEEAMDWLTRLESAEEKVRAEFASWLKQSPRHVGEFLLVSTVCREFDGVDPERRIDVADILAQVPVNVVTLEEGAAHVPRWRRWNRFVTGAAAAIAICAVVIGGLQGWGSQWKNYRTELGEQRIFELADGSTVYLNTHSQVQVRLSAAARDIRLVSGEALFKVAHNSASPFRVYSDGAVIQAIGTQFNVYRRARGTTVSVVEGAVRISTEGESSESDPMRSVPPVNRDGEGSIAEGRQIASAQLKAGEQTDITPDGRISTPSAANPVKATAWRQRRLVFQEDRLADIAVEFNRYNRAPRIRIEDETSKNRPLTGVFDADDPESLLQFLADVKEFSVERTADEVLIRSR